ncbi:hypothetical protein ACJJH9_16815 [Microbulbifer sp. DLAB2-AF]|uniref:hypothetical protein n=1 Tax=Microbulbifer sp. DLAB2-AF TaxID=3243395 RepID=UPI00403A3C77
MPGETFLQGYACAWQWIFDDVGSKTWKIIYNPASEETPECITCFTHDRTDHGKLQPQVDHFFNHTFMGRNGEAEYGTGHGNFHRWVGEASQDADIHPHDHWVIDRYNDIRAEELMKLFLTQLLSLNFISGPEHTRCSTNFEEFIRD